MKKRLIFAFIFMAAINVKAQNGTKFFSLIGGWIAKNAFTGTLSLDISTKYFNQKEIFAEYYQNYNNPDLKTAMSGFVIIPVMY